MCFADKEKSRTKIFKQELLTTTRHKLGNLPEGQHSGKRGEGKKKVGPYPKEERTKVPQGTEAATKEEGGGFGSLKRRDQERGTASKQSRR